MSHITDPTVVSKIGLCHRSQRPVSDRSYVWQCQKTENLVKKGMFVLVFTKFGLCSLLPHPIGCKYSQNSPIRALLQLLSVEFLALSRSPATCVEVSNWSNVSWSQECVKLIEMVQYCQGCNGSLTKIFQDRQAPIQILGYPRTTRRLHLDNHKLVLGTHHLEHGIPIEYFDPEIKEWVEVRRSISTSEPRSL